MVYELVVGVGGVCCDVDGADDLRTLGGGMFRAVGLIRDYKTVDRMCFSRVIPAETSYTGGPRSIPKTGRAREFSGARGPPVLRKLVVSNGQIQRSLKENAGPATRSVESQNVDPDLLH